MTYLLHNGYRFCDVCFAHGAASNFDVSSTYERMADIKKPFQQDECDACWTPLLISNEASFVAAAKSLPMLMTA